MAQRKRIYCFYFDIFSFQNRLALSHWKVLLKIIKRKYLMLRLIHSHLPKNRKIVLKKDAPSLCPPCVIVRTKKSGYFASMSLFAIDTFKGVYLLNA